MYIEFQLPRGYGSLATGPALNLIQSQLLAWSEKYDIPYKEKTVKFTHRVIFDDTRLYSFFALTWTAQRGTPAYSLVEPMGPLKSN